MPLALPSATVRYGVKSLVYWSRDTGELARSRRRSRDSCRQESVTGLPGWANKAPPTGPGRRVGPRRASGRRIIKKHARVARKRPRSMKPPRAATGARRNVSAGTDPSPLRRHEKANNARRRASRNNLRIHHRPGSENGRGRRRRQRNAGQDDNDLRASARRNRRDPREHRGPPRRGGRGARGWRWCRRSVEAPKNPMYIFNP